ncbi:hypothetical protein [Methylorubrum extorquens]|uniref:Uncharacterized protein n=1 Tax=Methylorubrum extorquens (strain CM4 / NCIMB 13688) TaxID=440085 RepID=B7KSD4_METC4|nr:hypothetical protein [Methylorubrum extorquens]ACK85602.1 hypothetical protein Mchl_4835 [Methylorubrum extorquens CM4]GEL44224.1 hypothetical protein MEX01_48150 [Methylorubrum extorquens]
MTEAIEHLKNWCTDQHKLLSKNLDLMERGLLHTSEGRVGGGVVDTTDASIARTKESLAELESVLQIIRDDSAEQPADGPSE